MEAVGRRDRAALLLFAAVFFLYLSLSPGSIGGMGYTLEEMRATDELFLQPVAFLSGDESIHWSRNGPLALLFHGPFIGGGNLVSGGDEIWVERILSIQPVLFSSLLVYLLFVWSRRLTGSSVWALVLAVVAAFGTFLWPYAYIGLETTQSLFIFVAGSMALGSSAPRSWGRTLLFALATAVAVSAKSTGAFLLPAAFFLIWRWDTDPDRLRPRSLARPLVAAAIVVAVFVVNSHYRGLFWENYGGSAGFVTKWLITGPISFFLNLVNFLFSGNKGLIVFAPVTLVSLYLLPRVWKTHRWIAIWALLVLGGLAGGFSLLTNWADETWGPRYLHSSIAPLVLCIAAAHVGKRFRFRNELALVLAACLGIVVSFFGSFFYYGHLHGAQKATGQPILEALQTDPVWNHIRFNERLFRIWLASDEAGDKRTWWVAKHKWFFIPPDDADPWQGVDLSTRAVPQSALVRTLEAEHRSPIDRIWLPIYLGSAVAGGLLLSLVVWHARRRDNDRRADGVTILEDDSDGADIAKVPDEGSPDVDPQSSDLQSSTTRPPD